jgi:signal transduction histidine kinase
VAARALLVMEDSAGRAVTEAVLRAAGREVLIAGDAASFAEAFAAGGFDLALISIPLAWGAPGALAGLLRRQNTALKLVLLGSPADAGTLRLAFDLQAIDLVPPTVAGLAALSQRLAVVAAEPEEAPASGPAPLAGRAAEPRSTESPQPIAPADPTPAVPALAVPIPADPVPAGAAGPTAAASPVGEHAVATLAAELRRERARAAALVSEVAALRSAVSREGGAEAARLAGEFAHDLREPLRSQRLLLERIEAALALGEAEAARPLVARLYDQSERLDALVGGALADLRGQTADASLTVTHADRVLDEVLESLAAALTESRATLVREPLPEVALPPHQLRQVLQNLVANALRHGGNPPRIVVSGQVRAGSTVLLVRDHGPGVPEASRESVFRPFARLAGSEPREGHGLGLAIVRKVAERAGGRVWVEAADGGGACFCVSVPVGVTQETTEGMTPVPGASSS